MPGHSCHQRLGAALGTCLLHSTQDLCGNKLSLLTEDEATRIALSEAAKLPCVEGEGLFA